MRTGLARSRHPPDAPGVRLARARAVHWRDADCPAGKKKAPGVAAKCLIPNVFVGGWYRD